MSGLCAALFLGRQQWFYEFCTRYTVMCVHSVRFRHAAHVWGIKLLEHQNCLLKLHCCGSKSSQYVTKLPVLCVAFRPGFCVDNLPLNSLFSCVGKTRRWQPSYITTTTHRDLLYAHSQKNTCRPHTHTHTHTHTQTSSHTAHAPNQ